MRTSYSSIQTYLQCPQKYKFQEIDRIRAPKSKEALFGTLIHGALKFMFQRDPLYPTLDEVIAHFREHWPSAEVWNAESKNDPLKQPWSPEEENAHREEGVRMLKRFYERNLPWNASVVDLESRFEIAIRDERTGETHIVAGVMDRIDKNQDETYEIVDYKTAKRMPSQEAISRDLQLSLYALGLQKRWPHLVPDRVRMSLYFLKHGEKLTTQPTAESSEKTKEHVLSAISDIQERVRSGKTFEPMPSALCNWCGYRPMCPAWRHLYRKQGTGSREQKDAGKIVREYFEIKKQEQENKKRIAELQEEIKSYMAEEKLTRMFGDEGIIAQKTVQRFGYDMEKIKTILSPLGKWEEILKLDEAKLKQVVRGIPAEARSRIEEARRVAKEYSVLTASSFRHTSGHTLHSGEEIT